MEGRGAFTKQSLIGENTHQERQRRGALPCLTMEEEHPGRAAYAAPPYCVSASLITKRASSRATVRASPAPSTEASTSSKFL
jgi:hypothetical protein